MKNQVPQTIITGIVEPEKEKVETEFELLRKKLLAGTIGKDGKPKMRQGRILFTTPDFVCSTRKVK